MRSRQTACVPVTPRLARAATDGGIDQVSSARPWTGRAPAGRADSPTGNSIVGEMTPSPGEV